MIPLVRLFRISRLAGLALLPTLILVPACAPSGEGGGGEGGTEGPAATAGTADVVPEPDAVLTDDQTHARFSAAIPAVDTVASGAVVEVHTAEASDGQLTPTSTAGDVLNLDFDPIHPLTGPVYVEGASPGDVLAVTLLDIEVGDWGWAAIAPGFGFLSDRFGGPYLKTFQIPEGATEVDFGNGMMVPLRPFPGVMGVAPATDSMLSTIPPRANGGNMDNRHMVEGVTVYFPVFVEGALFSVGDTHAAQGDGEVSGTAIEAPMRIRYRVEVLEGARPIAEPQYEGDDFYGVTAFGTDIDQATRKAVEYMIEYLVEEHGMTPEDAYVLSSLAGDLKISEVVDMPHYLVSMHMPKSVLAGGG